MPRPTKFIGGTVASAAGTGAGMALRLPLEPLVQEEANEVWTRKPNKPLDPAALADGVATGEIALDWAIEEAKKTGVSEARFRRLVDIADTGPGIAQAYRLLHRGELTEAGFRRALKRAGLEQEWIDALWDARDERLAPAQIALAIMRGILDAPGMMPVDLDTSGGTVEAYPVSPINPITEAAASGVSRERLRVMVGSIGLPMSLQQAASAVFRGIITRGDFNRAVLEGNTRPEWADAILEESRPIPSVTNYVEAFVRDWIDHGQFLAGTRRHGMDDADAELLFLTHGRPLSWHQVWIGLARGGQYDGPIGEIDAPFLKALRESNIRPEWYNLAWAQRYTLPSTMALRTLAQSGDLTPAEVAEILRHQGWEPSLAERVAARWATARASAAKEASATDLLTLYDGGRLTEAATLAALRELGYDDTDAQHKLDVIAARRVAGGKATAITDVHALYKKAEITTDDATARLERIGVPAWAATQIVADWLTARDGAA